MRPSFGLPVSPGTPFFPFFSSLFVFCFGRRKWRIPEQLRRREEAEAAELLRRRSPSSRSSRLFFFFFYFGRRKWRNPELLRRRGEAEAAELLRRRSRLVGEEEDSPTQNDVVLRLIFF